MASTTTCGEGPTRPSQFPIEHQRLIVTGLSCAAEAAGLERRLRRVAGVEEATVNPLTELAYVAYDPERCDPAALVAAIVAAGYRAG